MYQSIRSTSTARPNQTCTYVRIFMRQKLIFLPISILHKARYANATRSNVCFFQIIYAREKLSFLPNCKCTQSKMCECNQTKCVLIVQMFLHVELSLLLHCLMSFSLSGSTLSRRDLCERGQRRRGCYTRVGSRVYHSWHCARESF